MAAEQQKTVSLARELLGGATGLLEMVMQDVTDEQLHWIPPGNTNPIGATYAHTVISQDGLIHSQLQKGAPLCASTWADKTGLSELPPPIAGGDLPDWSEWARSVKIDLAQLRQYAQAVYASTDAYLATLTDEDLEQSTGFSLLGLGELTVKMYLFQIALGHVSMHCGEIGCLKGLQGMRGLPM